MVYLGHIGWCEKKVTVESFLEKRNSEGQSRMMLTHSQSGLKEKLTLFAGWAQAKSQEKEFFKKPCVSVEVSMISPEEDFSEYRAILAPYN